MFRQNVAILRIIFIVLRIIMNKAEERIDNMEKTPAWLQNTKMKECFDKLPKIAQESIMQGSNGFNSAEDMMKVAENFIGKSNKSE